MKPVGKPDAGNPHVRFDERGLGNGTALRVSTRARPRLYRCSSCAAQLCIFVEVSCVQDDKHRDESRCGSLKAAPRIYLDCQVQDRTLILGASTSLPLGNIVLRPERPDTGSVA